MQNAANMRLKRQNLSVFARQKESERKRISRTNQSADDHKKELEKRRNKKKIQLLKTKKNN